MKTISIPTFNRPALLAQCIAAIDAAKGNAEWTVVFSCEPHEETVKVAARWEHATYISRNAIRLGIWHNTFHAASVAMALVPSVNLYLEDDYLITPDTLTMVDQWKASGRPGVLCLRRWHESQLYNRPAVVAPAPHGLLGCGFAWRLEDWPLIRRAWFSPDEHGVYSMWDIGAAHFLNTARIAQWRPMVSRSNGIGTLGTHSRNGADQNLFGPAYAGTPVSEFTFVP